MYRPGLSSTDQPIDNWISPSHARVFAAPNLVGGPEPGDSWAWTRVGDPTC